MTKGRLAEAKEAGVKSVPALVIVGAVYHINHGADISILRLVPAGYRFPVASIPALFLPVSAFITAQTFPPPILSPLRSTSLRRRASLHGGSFRPLRDEGSGQCRQLAVATDRALFL
uniref:Uncharacterized protein n=1 Tax=Rhizobium loti TaxID=381 RepID=M5AL41_RHILI|nr:hypothetical protein [Mesorhizobium loti NZP2037]